MAAWLVVSGAPVGAVSGLASLTGPSAVWSFWSSVMSAVLRLSSGGPGSPRVQLDTAGLYARSEKVMTRINVVWGDSGCSTQRVKPRVQQRSEASEIGTPARVAQEPVGCWTPAGSEPCGDGRRRMGSDPSGSVARSRTAVGTSFFVRQTRQRARAAAQSRDRPALTAIPAHLHPPFVVLGGQGPVSTDDGRVRTGQTAPARASSTRASWLSLARRDGTAWRPVTRGDSMTTTQRWP